MVVRGGVRRHLVEEFAEIISNGQVNEHLLVEGGVVVTIDRLHVLKLGEVTERVGITHEILDLAVRLQALDHIDDVLDLVAVEHASEELVEGI